VQGDVFLDLEPGAPQLFLLGLASFLMGHIWYVVAFTASPGRRDSIPLAVVGVVYPLAFVAVLWGGLPSDMRLPVLVYGGVIASMAYTAVTRRRTSSGAWTAAVAGALLFVVSDSVLAWNRFVTPLPGGLGKLVVMREWNLGSGGGCRGDPVHGVSLALALPHVCSHLLRRSDGHGGGCSAGSGQ